MDNATKQGLAIITGASSGIGAAYADRLAGQGFSLLLVARREDRLKAVASDVSGRHHVAIETMVADLEQPEHLNALEARLVMPDVAMLVNNAGAGSLGPVAECTADKLVSVLSLNVVALTRLSRAALLGFRERKAGCLVNVGSVLASTPAPGGAAYSGSKAYVNNFTRSLQLEYPEPAIRIQLVQPGPVRTEFFSSQGLSDAVFPDASFITAEQLVDAALAGLAAGELVTSPTLANDDTYKAIETVCGQYVMETLSGQVATRYRVAAAGA